MFSVEKPQTGQRLIPVQVNAVASLTHLDGPFIYVGSMLGDSQVVRLLPPDPKNPSRSQVINSYTNIGPILDAALVEDEMSGQVMSSGYFNSDFG